MRKIFSVVVLGLVMVGCGEAADNKGLSNVHSVAGAQGMNSGSYDVKFPAYSGGDYSHTFSTPVAQDSLEVDYNLLTQNSHESPEVELVDVGFKVEGCSANQVNHKVFLIPDVKQPTVGQFITKGSLFRPLNGKPGVLRHMLSGLAGCSSVTLITSLKKGFVNLEECTASKPGEKCTVAARCRQTDSQFPKEIEIWRESRIFKLREKHPYTGSMDVLCYTMDRTWSSKQPETLAFVSEKCGMNFIIDDSTRKASLIKAFPFFEIESFVCDYVYTGSY